MTTQPGSLPLDTSEACCKTRNEVTIFSGTACVLSNLHDVEMIVDGVKYNSSEQFYQSQKCYDLNKPEVAKKVMQAPSGYDCMLEGNKVKASKEWTQSRGVDIMTKGVSAKFAKQECKEFLLNSRGQIAEATRNDRWGTGISFNDRRAFDVISWTGSNLMGDILTKYRDELIKKQHESSDNSMD